MATDKLSDARVRSIRPGAKPVKHFDGQGLFLLVQPSGVKLWRMAYRVGGKPQTASFGVYPEVTLAEARQRRDALRTAQRDGVDPRTVGPRPRGLTLTQACTAYWSGRHDVSEGYRANATRALAGHVEPMLGSRLIADVTREDLLVCLLHLDAAGRHVYVRRVRMWLGLVWEWAIEHGHAKANVPATIRPARAFASRPVEHFAALALPDVAGFMARLALEPPYLLSVLACRMLAYTWARTAEVRMMRWLEIDGDLWRIPAARMKRRRDHLVPLSSQAMALLERLRELSRGSEYVFPSDRRLDRPMSENAVLYLIGRIGYGERMTGHGWRSVGSTWANERGYPADVIERQLAHVPGDEVRSAYNRAEYLPQRRAMLQAFGEWVSAEKSA